MNGNILGLYALGVMLLVASGTVIAHGVSDFIEQKEEQAEQAYYDGMVEMHNEMWGTSLSKDQVISLHRDVGCI